MKFVWLMFCAVIISLSLSSNAYAWTTATQEYLANELCNELSECNGTYNQLMMDYSMYPDRWYVYPFTYYNHLNSYIMPNCPQGSWRCPDYYDQGALRATSELLNESRELKGKAKWKAIAMASHYYEESEEFWHKVRGEDYFSCHKRMEDLFDQNFRQNKTDFVVCTCGICENSTKLFVLKDHLKGYILTNTTPSYTIDPAGHPSRLINILLDWRNVANHFVEKTAPAVPAVVTMANETNILPR